MEGSAVDLPKPQGPMADGVVMDEELVSKLRQVGASWTAVIAIIYACMEEKEMKSKPKTTSPKEQSQS